MATPTRELRDPGTSPLWPIVAIAAITFIFYIPLFLNAFTTWDDSSTLWGNPAFNPPTLSGIAGFWLRPFMDLYVPVTYTLWGILSFIAYSPRPTAGGAFLSTTPFHLTNLALHIASAAVVFLLIRTLLRRAIADAPNATSAAFVGASLFALHPVQVESVAWLSGTKDVLYGLLSLLALLGYIHADASRRWYFLATLALIAALLAKPTAVVVPVMALAIDLVILHRPWRTRAGLLAPWLLLAAITAVIAKLVQPAHITPDVPLHLRPLVALDAVGFYLGKLAWPISLTIDYGRNPTRLFATGDFWWTWLPVVLVAAAAYIFRRRWPLVPLALLLFLLPIAPVVGFVRFDFQTLSTVADHYLYFSLFGIGLLVATLLARTVKRELVVTVAALLLLALGVRSMVQITTWRDSQKLFQHTLKINPDSWPAGNNLAVEALTRGDPLAAIALAERAAAHKPPYPDLYITLGMAYLSVGRMDDARDAYQQALDIDPNQADALASLAAIIAQQGNPEQGMQLARKAIEMDPRAAQPHMNLGVMLAEAGQTEPAARSMARAVELDPTNGEARLNLAILLWELNRPQEALTQARLAAQLRPHDPRAQGILQEMLTGRF